MRRLSKQDSEIMLPGVRFMAWNIMLEINQTVNLNRFVEEWFKKDGRVDLIVRGYYFALGPSYGQ